MDCNNGLLHYCPERVSGVDIGEYSVYKRRQMHRVVSVEQLVTIHYLSSIRNAGTPPERHDFWELVYVDYGGIELIADGNSFSLGPGELFLHVPGQLHAFRAGGAPTAVFIISFSGEAACLYRIGSRPLRAGADARKLIPLLIGEIQNMFGLDDPSQVLLRDLTAQCNDTPLGAEQMICNYMEQLLIALLRGSERSGQSLRGARSGVENSTVSRAVAYIQSHLGEKLSVPLIAAQVNYSRAYFSEVFASCLGMSVMEYVEEERIRHAKRMLAENELSITGIAAQLGFSSVHYFSRRFRLKTGSSPTDYAASLQSELQRLLPDAGQLPEE